MIAQQRFHIGVELRCGFDHALNATLHRINRISILLKRSLIQALDVFGDVTAIFDDVFKAEG